MPTDLFFELSLEKRARVTQAGLAEFARYGYANSSTNRMVAAAEISKGSLFKYFQNKEELYFYILDRATQALTANLSQQTAQLPGDLFERVVEYSKREFAWYMEHPQEYKLILRAFTKSEEEIYQKTEARYSLKGRDIYEELLAGVDTAPLKWGEQKTADVLRWFLKGFNEEFIAALPEPGTVPLERLRDEYVKKLTEYLAMLQSGLLMEKGRVS